MISVIYPDDLVEDIKAFGDKHCSDFQRTVMAKMMASGSLELFKVIDLMARDGFSDDGSVIEIPTRDTRNQFGKTKSDQCLLAIMKQHVEAAEAKQVRNREWTSIRDRVADVWGEQQGFHYLPVDGHKTLFTSQNEKIDMYCTVPDAYRPKTVTPA